MSEMELPQQDNLITPDEAARIMSRRAGYKITPEDLKQLRRYGRIKVARQLARTTLYERAEIEKAPLPKKRNPEKLETESKKLESIVDEHRPEYFSNQPTTDITTYAFEQLYEKQAVQRNKYITPPNFDIARKLPIEQLFVQPVLLRIPTRGNKPPIEVKQEEIFRNTHRAVIVGSPGSGKSTLVHKLCYDLAAHNSQNHIASKKELVPLLVILRDYAAEKKEHRSSILEFIETEAKATYQLPSPPKRTFEYLLLSGRALVIFDGLDELSDSNFRQEIRDDIEAFCHLYSSAHVLVTSRDISYEQAPLDEKQFELFRLAPFAEKQVIEYVTKWFNLMDIEATSKQRQLKVDAFMKESCHVADLRSNPLMLALLCGIYREENYIPKHRTDVYEKCATMLFERWDKSRNLYFPPIMEEHVRPLIEYLAHWIYTDERLRMGVPENALLTKTILYLNEWLFENVDKAERMAHEFIQFCVGRVWVFFDVGTNKEGEKLFQFAHASFLDYFAASYIVRTSRTPSELIATLLPKIKRGEWDVMSQLAFQIQAKRLLGAGDELIINLLNQPSQEEHIESWNILFFITQCLHFIVPKPAVIRTIVEECLNRVLIWGTKVEQEHREVEITSITNLQKKVLESLLSTTIVNNRAQIATCLEGELTRCISVGRDIEALLAIEISTHLVPSIRFDIFQSSDDFDFWRNLSTHIFGQCADKLLSLYPKYFYACYEGVLSKKVSIIDLIRWHGIESLFASPRLVIYSLPIPQTIIEHFVMDVLYLLTEKSELDIYSLEVLREIGNILLDTPPPLVERRQAKGDDRRLFAHLEKIVGVRVNIEKIHALDAEVLFAIFLYYALWMEAGHYADKLFQMLKSSNFPIPQIGRMLLARSDITVRDIVQQEMNEIGFSRKQREFAWNWIQGNISLLK